ncbi:hypothetical protein SAMN05660706_13545 [Desulfoscipio geothermicus DSM 3669]|uniref:Uncharacterized protein n=1 Tax=Desulfoscipio geothermicus DSM 3669 TaxID=1121426 RepID=A0A1I6ECV0_9FIRM|nr:hypothetical protein SAMN05660706_13545 [Desulfoscipio geothermicus DSM 3669]
MVHLEKMEMATETPGNPGQGQVFRSRQGRPVKRRWRAERCVPLQVLAWILGAILMMPLWLWLIGWWMR